MFKKIFKGLGIIIWGFVASLVAAFLAALFVQWLLCENLHYWPPYTALLAYLLSCGISLGIGMKFSHWNWRAIFVVGMLLAFYPAFFITILYAGSRACRTYEWAYESQFILHGIIVDNLCAEMHKDDLTQFIKTHEKICMLKPEHLQSGYSIYAEEDGQLHKFDEKSNQKVADFLKNLDSKTDVRIIANKADKFISIKVIKNQ